MFYKEFAAVYIAVLLAFVIITMAQESASNGENLPKAAAGPLSPAIVAYLNNRINQLLSENPAKDPLNLRLANAFNEERRKLRSFLIAQKSTTNDDTKVEQAIENFRNFLQHYNEVEKMLQMALDEANIYEENKTLATEIRYKALMLKQELKNGATLKEAEKALRLFEDFKKSTENETTPPPATTAESAAGLSDQYREYFEDILMILKTHAEEDALKMENLLREILANTEQLLLSEALRDISDDNHENTFLGYVY